MNSIIVPFPPIGALPPARAVDEVPELEEVDQVLDSLEPRRLRDVVKGPEEIEVLAAGELPVETAIAHEHAADRGPDEVLLGLDVVPVHPGGPGRREQDRREALDESRLPGAVRS